MSELRIADRTFTSRLFLGTGKFGNLQQMAEAIQVSETELVTVAMRRVDLQAAEDDLLGALQGTQVHQLPNTSVARNEDEAVLSAYLAREAVKSIYDKPDIHPTPRYLHPIA